MTTAIAPTNTAELLERVVIGGDLSKLQPGERLQYYRQVCEGLGLNPLTQPFQYITLNGKLVLYARRDATDQLRRLHNISIAITARVTEGEVYIVHARATMGERTDESLGAVPLGRLSGESYANAIMKCETKAKRRVTLSICGLGMLDETEVETIPASALKVVPEPEPEPVNGPQEMPAHPAAPVQDWLDALKQAQSKTAVEHLKAGLRQVWGTFPKAEQDLLEAAVKAADKRFADGAA